MRECGSESELLALSTGLYKTEQSWSFYLFNYFYSIIQLFLVCFIFCVFLTFYFILEHSQLTVSWSFQVDSQGTQPSIYMYPFCPKLPSHPSCHITLSSFLFSKSCSFQNEPHSYSSVAQSYLTLCDPTDCSTPGLPVHHQLPELAQTHVHWVGDAIQPSHPPHTSQNFEWWLSEYGPRPKTPASPRNFLQRWIISPAPDLLYQKLSWCRA